MTQFFSEAIEAEKQSRGAMRLRHLGLALVAALTLGAMAFIFWDIDRQLNHNKVSDSDNVTWVIAQVEVDLLKLQRAAREAEAAPADPAVLDRLKLAYDIFYSRMLVVKRSDDITTLPIDVELREKVWAPGGFFDRYTPLIDGPTQGLVGAVPAMVQELDGMMQSVREQVVLSLQGVMGEADRDRADLRRSLQVFAAAALALLGLMLGLSTVIFLQSKAEQRRSHLTARAVHNLRATIESALDAVVIADAKGRIIDCNRAAESLFQTSRTRARGARFSDLVGADGVQDPLSQLHLQLRGKDNWAELRDGRIEMKAKRSDGVTVPVEAALAEAKGAGGEPMFIAFLRDISERLEREESLRSARNDALKGEEAKARFLAVMSHEMRTPLNGLIAAAELMQSSTSLDERQAWLSEIVLSCGWAALDQVNNVLELTRLGSASAVSYPDAVFSPEQVLRDLILQNEPHAAKRGNQLVLDIKAGTVPQVRAPRQLFLRVLYNLIGNAIKFTDSGTVTVRLTTSDAQDGKVRLQVSITDTGIGVAHDDLERIFQNFQTLDDSYARMREGTGLGLGIAKLSAEALGGEIRVASKLGEGSTFTLDVALPVAEVEAEGHGAPSRDIAEGREMEDALSILVAEDNPINSLLLTEMLRLRGHRVTVTADGQEAVDQATTTRFDMVLMDISMPRMDGLEATRRIRQAGKSRDVPVIGVTANASPDRLPEFMAAGMNDVIVKPITRRALADMLMAHSDGGSVRKPEIPQTGGANMLNDDVFNETVEEMGRDFVERIAAKYLTEVEEALDEITAALATDPAAAGRIAHKSAGGAAAIGLGAIHQALGRVEHAANDGDTAKAAAALADARAALPATVQALRAHGLSVGAQTSA